MVGKLRNMTSLYLYDDRGILCLYRVGSRVANNKYVGSAGGHFEKDELNDPRACVLREAEEELGLTEGEISDFRLRYITLRRTGGEIRQHYYFFGRLKDPARTLASTEGKLRWVAYEDIPTLDMPISAKHMILHYCTQGRFDGQLYAGITEESGTDFIPMREF